MKILSLAYRFSFSVLTVIILVTVLDLRAATPPPMVQEAYVKPFNTGTNDRFGASIAISGDTMVVGAPNEDSNGTGVNDYGNALNDLAPESGAAYIFVRSGTNWNQQAYLKASNARAGDAFGQAVAISGDTVVVGAPYEETGAPASGAAYVFVRSGTTWSQQAYLKASNAGTNDSFGISVGVSSNIVVVGAPLEASNAIGVNGDQSNNSAFLAGAAYVFSRSGTTWTQEAYLKASNTEAGDAFGVSVAVSGSTVVVGAESESSSASIGNQSDNSAPSSGAVYVFARDGAGWAQRAFLKAANGGSYDNFGASVAIWDQTLVIGTPGQSTGAAYVFVSNSTGTLWTQQDYLKASNAGIGDQFGHSVAVSGKVAVVGAHFEASSATGVNPSIGQENNNFFAAGAAYVFVQAGTTWSQLAYVKASNTGAGDHPSDLGDVFGYAVAVSGDTMVSGAPRESSFAIGVNGNQTNNAVRASGAAYVFTGFVPPDGPEIAVEQPAGVNLIDGKAIVEFGVVPVGSSRDLTFRVHNRGNDLLTGLSIAIDGDQASDFSIISSPTPSIASGSNTSFTIRFTPIAAGFRSAKLHLVSNDGNENPFDITLTSVPSVPAYEITAFAGNGVRGSNGDGGAALEAELNAPKGLAVDSAGNVYIADNQNNRIRRVGIDGIITTIAGTGATGFSGDGGPATQAELHFPLAVDVDSEWNVYFADVGNNRVRRVDINGFITTVAGRDGGGIDGDGGPATQAQLGSILGVAVDAVGNVYLTSIAVHRVRRVDTNGIITTVAGTGVGGFSGDGGPATLAQLDEPGGVAVDGRGNLFIADRGNHRIRRLDTNGIISTIAGTGANVFRGDGGPATNAALSFVTRIALDAGGNMFIAADSRIRRVDTNGVIATVAGNGDPYGPLGSTALNTPAGFVEGLAVDATGNIFFTPPKDQVWRLVPTGAAIPLKPIYDSTPPIGLLIFPDFEVGTALPTQISLFIGNRGASDLRIDSIGFADTNASEMTISGLPAFPHIITSGADEVLELTLSWLPIDSGVVETQLRVVSNDPVTPAAVYTVVGSALDPVDKAAENIFANWFVRSVGSSLAGGSPKQSGSAARKNISLAGPRTAVLTVDTNMPQTLTAEVPAFLGGGSVQLSNFTGGFTVSLTPIPNDFERAFIRVEGGTLTAPSLRLPSGLDTGLNRLTFGPPEQSGGVLFLTNGSYTAYATARIVNDLIPDGVTVRGNYSGIYDPETGQATSQSQSVDLFESSGRVLLSHSTNGLRLTWANTNALEEATDLLGPWRPVTNAASPLAVVTTNHQQQFFRLRPSGP